LSSNSFGDNFKITTFGESQGKAIGVLIDGVMPGLELDEAEIQIELDKRKPSTAPHSTTRKEEDKIEILSGVFDKKTTGAPLCMIVRNCDTNPKDYEAIKNIFRPGHADFAYFKKYGIRDYRGGGRSSGRETVARVAAGAVAKKLLMQDGIQITGFIKELNGVCVEIVDYNEINNNELKCPDKSKINVFREMIKAAKNNGDSIGGVIEIHINNVPPGLGDPVFDKLDANYAKALMSIGAVKGVEVGRGFELTKISGFESNDQMNKNGFLSNNMGGIIGGISTGQDIVLRAAVKPTSSIKRKQKTIDISGNEVEIELDGRFDVCICPRVVPVAESMVAITTIDALLKQKAIKAQSLKLQDLRLLIDGCDQDLLEIIAKRQEISKLISKIKKLEEIGTEDLRREKEVMNNWSILAKELGLNTSKVCSIYETLCEMSKEVQQ